jgi:hypothetical protein
MRDLATRKVRVPCSGFAPYLELTFSSVYQSASLSMRRANLIVVQVVITQAMLQEAWDGLRGAVTIAYPQGLPEYDEVNASSLRLLLPLPPPPPPPTLAAAGAGHSRRQLRP